MKYELTLTDTYGDEPNFAWVRRYTIEAPDDLKWSTVIRRLKRKAEITARHRTEDYGTEVILRFPARNVVGFITYIEPEP